MAPEKGNFADGFIQYSPSDLNKIISVFQAMDNNKQSKIDGGGKSSQAGRKKARDKSNNNRNTPEDGFEEFIAPDPRQKNEKDGATREADGMGISKKAKKQSSDERDVAKGKS